MAELKKFIFKNTPIRGQIVKIDSDWNEIINRQKQIGNALPTPVQNLIGQMSAAAILMQSNIKFNGALILQILGDSALKVAVVEANSDLSFRATAKIIGSINDSDNLTSMTNQKQQGRCAITLAPKNQLPGQQPYQGIISLNLETNNDNIKLSDVLENYMQQSEQLETCLVLAANPDVAAGILIQRLPITSQTNVNEEIDQTNFDEDFNRIVTLSKSLTEQELLELDIDTILQRLFWQEQIQIFIPEQNKPHFYCNCNRNKVGNMLLSLGKDEANSILEEFNSIDVNCDFCGKLYQFDLVDVEQLFANAGTLQTNLIQ